MCVHCLLASIVSEDLVDTIISIRMTISLFNLSAMRILSYLSKVHGRITKANNVLVEMGEEMHLRIIEMHVALHYLLTLYIALILSDFVEALFVLSRLRSSVEGIVGVFLGILGL